MLEAYPRLGEALRQCAWIARKAAPSYFRNLKTVTVKASKLRDMILKVPSNFKEVSPGILEWFLRHGFPDNQLEEDKAANGVAWLLNKGPFDFKTVALKVNGKCYIPK